MNPIDWVVFLLFIAWVVWDGMRRSRGTKDLEGYYAGSRSIPWWAAGLSVMATQASAITVIGTTGQGYYGGMEFIQMYFGLAFSMILLSAFLVPLYRSQAILTAYEYLEGRFGPATRSLASAIFLVSRCLALGWVIYAPSVVLSAMLGLNTTVSVLCIGVLTTAYTVVGGVTAVIWTDVKQMLVIIGGLVLVVGILLYDLLQTMSFGEVLEVTGAAGKLNALEVQPESTDLGVRTLAEVRANQGTPSFWEEKYNFWSGAFGGLFLHLAYFGCDQSQVQRILTNPTARESRLALLLSAFAKVPMQFLVLFIGVLIYLFFALGESPMLFKPAHQQLAAEPANAAPIAAFQQRFDIATEERREAILEIAREPGPADPDSELVRDYQESVKEVAEIRKEARTFLNGGEKDDADTNYVFCYFILDNLPVILLGLVIAAIFAAAMSSIDSALNALSAATIVDFYRRWIRPSADDGQSLRAGRVCTLFWGMVATGTALFYEGVGSVIEGINKVGSFFYGSLLGVFALALLVPRADGRAGFLGLVAGMGSVLAVHFTVKVEFLWYNVIGCLGVLLVGGLVSLLPRR